MSMFKKSKQLFIFLGIFTFLFAVQILYLFNTQTNNKNEIQLKNNFVKTTTLPDLAISSETTYVRHRSLATHFDIYRDDTALLEYYPSTFTYKAKR